MDLQEVFITNLKKYRKKAGITQEELSEKLNKTISYVSKIECKMILPSFAVIEEISEILKIEPYMLFSPKTQVFTKEITNMALKLSTMTENQLRFIDYMLDGIDKIK